MDQNYFLFVVDGKDLTNNNCVVDKIDGGKGFITHVVPSRAMLVIW